MRSSIFGVFFSVALAFGCGSMRLAAPGPDAPALHADERRCERLDDEHTAGLVTATMGGALAGGAGVGAFRTESDTGRAVIGAVVVAAGVAAITGAVVASDGAAKFAREGCGTIPAASVRKP